MRITMKNTKTSDVKTCEIKDSTCDYQNEESRKIASLIIRQKWIELGKIEEEDGKILGFADGYDQNDFEKEVTEYLIKEKANNNLVKVAIRSWARKLVREKWIEAGKIIVAQEAINEKFKKGYNSKLLKKEVAEFENDVVWKKEV